MHLQTDQRSAVRFQNSNKIGNSDGLLHLAAVRDALFSWHFGRHGEAHEVGRSACQFMFYQGMFGALELALCRTGTSKTFQDHVFCHMRWGATW